MTDYYCAHPSLSLPSLTGQSIQEASTLNLLGFRVKPEMARGVNSKAGASLKVVSSQVNKTAVAVDVCIVDTQPVVGLELASKILQLYPNLAKHACKSGASSLFGHSIVGALLPHLAEHLAIELLVQADNSAGLPSRPYAGNTVWISHKNQTMRIRVLYYDANATEAALYDAIAQINLLI